MGRWKVRQEAIVIIVALTTFGVPPLEQPTPFRIIILRSHSRTTPGYSPAIVMSMAVLALLILNKSGGLIYHRNFNAGLQQLSSNDYLLLAGTFHGVHAITSVISPSKTPHAVGTPRLPAGLEVMETERFRMQCFQTLTGRLHWNYGSSGWLMRECRHKVSAIYRARTTERGCDNAEDLRNLRRLCHEKSLLPD